MQILTFVIVAISAVAVSAAGSCKPKPTTPAVPTTYPSAFSSAIAAPPASSNVVDTVSTSTPVSVATSSAQATSVAISTPVSVATSSAQATSVAVSTPVSVSASTDLATSIAATATPTPSSTPCTTSTFDNPTPSTSAPHVSVATSSAQATSVAISTPVSVSASTDLATSIAATVTPTPSPTPCTTSTFDNPTPTASPPTGYFPVFTNSTGAISASDYDGFVLVDTLQECFDKCAQDTISDCNYVNFYFDKNGKGGSQQYTCAMFTKCHTVTEATNLGGQSQPDGSIDQIVNSSGWCKNPVSAPGS